MLREDHYKDNQNQKQNQQQNQQSNQPQSLTDIAPINDTATTTTNSIVTRNDSNMVTAALNSSSSTEQSSVLPKARFVSPNHHHHQFLKSISLLSKFYHKNHCSWPHCYYRQQLHYHSTSSIIKSRLRYINNSQASVYYQNNTKRCHHHLHLLHITNIHSFKKAIRRFNNKNPQPTCNNKPSIDPPINWTPPICYDTLKELSINHIFKSLQLRHDLLFDPNLSFRPNLDGPSGRDKRNKAERYWRRVDQAFEQQQDWTFLQVIIQELSRILVSLMHPTSTFPHIAAVVAGHTTLPWHWPLHITRHQIHDVLDSDLIIQQLKHSKRIGNQVEWLKSTFETLLIQPQPLQQPQQQQHYQHQQNTARMIDVMSRYFAEGRYARALRQCFSILENIKLNCANRVLGHYRNFLIQTCAEFEYRCFIKHQYELVTVDAWLTTAWKRFGGTTSHSFQQVYYAGLVHLVIDDDEILDSLDISLPQAWPITFQFDQKRMTRQFRYEFQHMLVMAIMLVPYRQLADVDPHHVQKLKKQVYAKLIQPNTTPLGLEEKTYRQLAKHACQTAQAEILPNKVTFWEGWMVQNIKRTSAIFKLMYERLSRQLQYVARYGKLMPVGEGAAAEAIGLEDEIRALGLKLKMVADLNLDAFSKVYNNRVINKT